MQKGEAFLASPAVQATLSNEQGQRCSAHSIYVLEGQVPADLEAIFCRGVEWDCGVEHVLLLQVKSSRSSPAVSCKARAFQGHVHISDRIRLIPHMLVRGPAAVLTS